MATILILEPDEPLGASLSEAIEQAGLRTIVQENAADVADLLAVDPPALIVLDLAIEDRRGVEVCQQIRDTSGGELLPILMLGTGEEGVQSFGDALAEGGDYYFDKPLDYKKLISKILTYVGVDRESPTVVAKPPEPTADDLADRVEQMMDLGEAFAGGMLESPEDADDQPAEPSDFGELTQPGAPPPAGDSSQRSELLAQELFDDELGAPESNAALLVPEDGEGEAPEGLLPPDGDEAQAEPPDEGQAEGGGGFPDQIEPIAEEGNFLQAPDSQPPPVDELDETSAVAVADGADGDLRDYEDRLMAEAAAEVAAQPPSAAEQELAALEAGLLKEPGPADTLEVETKAVEEALGSGDEGADEPEPEDEGDDFEQFERWEQERCRQLEEAEARRQSQADQERQAEAERLRLWEIERQQQLAQAERRRQEAEAQQRAEEAEQEQRWEEERREQLAEAERKRLAEEERERIEREEQAEQERLWEEERREQLAEVERKRQEDEERDRTEKEEQERLWVEERRQQLEEAERRRQAAEAERQRRCEEERQRQLAKAEQKALAEADAVAKRREAEEREREGEEERQRLEEEERQRLEEEERQRLEEEERQRLEEEERQRLEEEERQRLEEEERQRLEEEERERQLEEEPGEAEEDRPEASAADDEALAAEDLWADSWEEEEGEDPEAEQMAQSASTWMEDQDASTTDPTTGAFDLPPGTDPSPSPSSTDHAGSNLVALLEEEARLARERAEVAPDEDPDLADLAGTIPDLPPHPDGEETDAQTQGGRAALTRARNRQDETFDRVETEDLPPVEELEEQDAAQAEDLTEEVNEPETVARSTRQVPLKRPGLRVVRAGRSRETERKVVADGAGGDAPGVDGEEGAGDFFTADSLPAVMPPDPEATDLGSESVPAVLWRLHVQAVSGTVTFRSAGDHKQVFFERGIPVGIRSSQTADRLEEILYHQGLIDREAYAEARVKGLDRSRALAAHLVERGLLRPEELFPTVRRHLEDCLLGLFEWRTGRVNYEPVLAPDAEMVRLAMPVSALVVEGIRRKFLLPRMMEELGGPASLLAPIPADDRGPEVPEPGTLGLSRGEAEVLRLVDGLRPIEEIVFLSGHDVAVVYQVLLAAVVLGLARVAVRGLHSADADPEQARQRDVDIRRRRLDAKFKQIHNASYFDILGVAPHASPYEIKTAFERLSREFHTLHYAHPALADLATKLDVIQRTLIEARDVLSDELLREGYRSALGQDVPPTADEGS